MFSHPTPGVITSIEYLGDVIPRLHGQVNYKYGIGTLLLHFAVCYFLVKEVIDIAGSLKI